MLGGRPSLREALAYLARGPSQPVALHVPYATACGTCEKSTAAVTIPPTSTAGMALNHFQLMQHLGKVSQL